VTLWEGRSGRMMSSALVAGLTVVMVGLMAAAAAAGTWTRAQGTLGSDFDGVACVSGTDCELIDAGANGNGSELQRWNGRAVFTQRLTLPAGLARPQDTSLQAISCRTAIACTAVGYYFSAAARHLVPLIERWNGTSWSAQGSPDPNPGQRSPLTAHDSELFSVSCPTASFCQASGTTNFDRSQGAFARPFSEIWNGRRWSIEHPGALGDVSCSSASFCLGGSSLHYWDGTQWTAFSAASMVAAQDAGAPSCPAAGACVTLASGHDQADAALLSGGVWTHTVLPTIPDTSFVQTYALSCGSTSSCVGVGEAGITSDGDIRNIDVIWNGTTWTLQLFPLTTQNQLDQVSCWATGCLAVGSQRDGGGFVYSS
jgi:hypothetical protein